MRQHHKKRLSNRRSQVSSNPIRGMLAGEGFMPESSKGRTTRVGDMNRMGIGTRVARPPTVRRGRIFINRRASDP